MADEKLQVPFVGTLHLKEPAYGQVAPKLLSGKTVRMEFPTAVTLLLDHATKLEFNKGIQDVPIELTEWNNGPVKGTGLHWWLASHKVVPYVPKQVDTSAVVAPTRTLPAVTEHHIKFLVFRGYAVDSVKGVEEFIDNNLTGAQTREFFKEAEEWNEAATTAPTKPLDQMTKAELVAHAGVVHDLELDVASKKEDLLAAINKAEEAKKKQTGNGK